MVNVDDERTQKPTIPEGAGAAPRAGAKNPRGGVITPFKDEDVDPQEFSRMLDIYDNSFRNIAEGEVMKGTVLKVTPSEVIVDIGYKSEGIIGVDEFLDERGEVTVQPGDTVDVLLERTEDRDGYVVLSRKVLLEEENAEKKKHTLHTLAEGKVLKGTVKNITDYGAFIDLGGIDGLLHITDMSWGRVGHPSELFKVND